MKFEELKLFYNKKKVFVTGHTGFKGTWLCIMLSMLGAEVYGYSLDPASSPSMFDLLNLEKIVHSAIGDVRDFRKLKSCMEEARPELVFHLAAQPIVRESYRTPRETFETNVMGTVANSHFPRPAGPHFPARQGHIKRPVLESGTGVQGREGLHPASL